MKKVLRRKNFLLVQSACPPVPIRAGRLNRNVLVQATRQKDLSGWQA